MTENDGCGPEMGDEPLTGPVKWYDPDKGFGFVLLGAGEDAFLHASVLRRSGHGGVAQGDRVTCLVAQGGRGLTVREVVSVERVVGASADEGVPATVHLEGKVKFYDLERGYGFVRTDSGVEVFVGSKLLKRLGLAPLRAEQAVRVTAAMGERGLVAETLTFVS